MDFVIESLGVTHSEIMAKCRDKRKRAAMATHKCLPCDVFISSKQSAIDEHCAGRTHLRLERVFLYLVYFIQQGITFMEGRKGMQCVQCNEINIHASLEKIEAHLQKKHNGASWRSSEKMGSDSLYTGNERFKVVFATHINRPKVYWQEEYNVEDMDLKCEQLRPPVCIKEAGVNGNILLTVVNGHFSGDDIQFMEKEAVFLEKHGNVTKRGGLKGGTRMVTYGVRHANGEIGWYTHDHVQCHKRSEDLAIFISVRLKKYFTPVFTHLTKIREMENMPSNVGCLGETPFTGMSITINYTCNPHLDEDDYSYCFFIWLGQDGSPDANGNSTKVYFPGFHSHKQAGYFLEPKVGDILCFKSSQVEHCTRSIGEKGQFGIALYQKTSFYRWYNIVHERTANEGSTNLSVD